MGGWDSWANRVALALTSPAELSAMRAFFRALWTTVNSSERDTIRVDGLEVLHALTYLFDSVLEFLEALDPCTTPMAALNLVDICLSFPGGTVGGRQPPPELTQWFAERAQAALRSAGSRFPPQTIDQEIDLEMALTATERAQGTHSPA
jgi:hypothetical protein